MFFSVTASLRGMTFGFLNQRFVYKLRTRLFENLLRQDITFHDQSDVGVLTSRLTSDCSSMSRILGMNINLLIRNTFKAIGGACYLWVMSPRFFGQTLVSLLVILLINVKYGAFSRKAAKTEQEQLALGNQIATEVLTLVRTVRIFGTEGEERVVTQFGESSIWLRRSEEPQSSWARRTKRRPPRRQQTTLLQLMKQL